MVDGIKTKNFDKKIHHFFFHLFHHHLLFYLVLRNKKYILSGDSLNLILNINILILFSLLQMTKGFMRMMEKIVGTQTFTTILPWHRKDNANAIQRGKTKRKKKRKKQKQKKQSQNPIFSKSCLTRVLSLFSSNSNSNKMQIL